MKKRYYTPKWSRKVYDKQTKEIINCLTHKDALKVCKLLNNEMSENGKE